MEGGRVGKVERRRWLIVGTAVKKVIVLCRAGVG